MLTILNATAPIYLLIALGFFSVRQGWMTVPDIRSVGRFVARFGLPALLFRAIAAQPLETIVDARYLAAYGAGSLASMLLVRTCALKLRRRSTPLASLQGLGSSSSNSAFVGYPIVLQVVGPVAGTALALCALVENVVMIPLGLALADASPGGATRVWRSQTADALRGLLRNPMSGGIVLGVVVAAFQWHLPPALDRALALLAGGASAASLFVIGGSLVGIKIVGIRSDIALVTVGKLCLHPACVAACMLLLEPHDPALRAAGILFAAMPMLSILPILAQQYDEEAFSAAALLTVIVTSFFTIGVVIGLLPASWVLPAR
jgi:malonate transporter